VQFSIRPYDSLDQSQIEWLHQRTPPAGQVSTRPTPIPDDLRQIDRHYPAFFVATEPIGDMEAIIGMAGVAAALSHRFDVPAPDFVRVTTRTARLRHVVVAPERSRRGIGRALVETAVEWARSQQYRSLMLSTTTQQEAAVDLYRTTGFREIGRSTYGRWELMWFERPL
jgi:GNAT superfamily N-acetyltransferase